MILRKRLKAGVLLYALLMVAVFSLLLQFYLNRVVAQKRQIQAVTQANKAYMMASLTKDWVKDKQEESGTIQFNHGSSQYRYHGDELEIQVQLKNQKFYSYQFHMPKSLENDTDLE